MKRASRYLLSSVLALCVTVVIADEPASATSTTLGVAPKTLQALDGAKKLFVGALQSSGKERVSGLQASYQTLVEAVKADAVLPPARTIWAKMLLSVGDQKSALATLQQAVLEHPEDPEAYVILANEASRRNQLAEANLLFEAAAARMADWPEEQLRRPGIQAQIAAGLATVSQSRSRLAARSQQPEIAVTYAQAALGHLREWVELAPENASAHDQLAAALLRGGDEAGAVKAFDRARELNPRLPLTDLRLAQTQIANGDQQAANASLNRAVESHAQDVDVLETAADLWMAMGELDKSDQQIAAALRADPNRLAALRLQAQLQRFRGDFSVAAEQLQSLNAEHPTDFETANLLAMTLTELDQASRQRAIPIATVTAQRFDADTREGLRARITLIWAAQAAGQTETAKRALNQLLTVGVQSNQISGDEGYFLSRLLVDFGRPELAQPMLQSVLTRVGEFPKRKAAQKLASQLN